METSNFKDNVCKTNDFLVSLGNDSFITFANDLSFAILSTNLTFVSSFVLKFLVRTFGCNFNIMSVNNRISIFIDSDF